MSENISNNSDATAETTVTDVTGVDAGVSESEGSQAAQEAAKYTQADIDRKSREIAEKYKRQAELEKKKLHEDSLKEQQKFKELFEQRDAELARLKLASETAKAMADEGLGDFVKAFDADLSTLEGRVEHAKYIKKYAEDLAKKMVEEKLKTTKTPTNQPSAGAKPKTIDDFRKKHGYF